MMKLLSRLSALLLPLLVCGLACAADFDPEAATRHYLDSIPAATRANSDAYFTGGYWLQALDLIYGLGVAWLLLATHWSANWRERIGKKISHGFLRTMTFIGLYIVANYILSFPLSVYEGYIREHAYGFATQDFVHWFADEGKGLAISIIFNSLGVALLYVLIRRLKSAWVMWGTAVSIAMMTFAIFVSPVLIEPLFNDYKPMPEGPVKTEILRIAHANSIPTSDVFMVDASRQTNRVSANVAGLGSTVRIALNDNLLNRASPQGVAAVMGHEMGHYVLNHVVKSLVFFAVIIALGFYFIDRGYAWVQRRWGQRFGTGDIGDEAGLPIVVALLSVFMFLSSPINKSIIRSQEMEADFFGLNAARQPDGFAEGILLTAEYRKAEPGYWEEILFYDHPSPHTRILNAMKWKAMNLEQTPIAPAKPAETPPIETEAKPESAIPPEVSQ